MATTKRVSKIIKDKELIDKLLNLTEDEITSSFIMDTFGEFDGKVNANPYDIITIPRGVYGYGDKKNKNSFDTTVGRWIFNKYFIEPHEGIFNILKYVNDDITKKSYKTLVQLLTYSLVEDELSIPEFETFAEKTQKFMPFVSILSPGYTTAMLTVSAKINKEKARLIKLHQKEIDEGNIYVVDEITKELLDYARELLKDDPSMDMYLSGSRGSFENNFKNMFVMRGAVKDPDPTKGYNIITSNYIDGVSKEDYPKIANSLAAGPYARAKKTEIGGYWEKLFLSAFQHVVLLDPGTDCGTTRTITVKVDKNNIDDLMYNYVQEGSNLVEITSKNKSKYIGKTIKMRFASMCESKNGLCNKCAGNLWYRIGIRNVGTATPQLPSKLKVLSLKLFHDSQVDFAEMDPMHAFGLD